MTVRDEAGSWQEGKACEFYIYSTSEVGQYIYVSDLSHS